MQCLNPFEFRAGIYFTDGMVKCLSMRLNPFEFRAGIYLALSWLAQTSRVLIPLNSGLVFTFNPGIETVKLFGLNPFEFRAGIYFAKQSSLASQARVLIPLNSGLVFTWHRPKKRDGTTVYNCA